MASLKEFLEIQVEMTGIRQATTGLRGVRENLDSVDASAGATTGALAGMNKSLLAVAGVAAGAAIAIASVWKSSVILQTFGKAAFQVWKGFLDRALTPLIPVFTELLALFQEIGNDVLPEVIPFVQDMATILREHLLPVLKAHKPELKILLRLFLMIVASGVIGFIGGMAVALVGLAKIVRGINGLIEAWSHIIPAVVEDVSNGISTIIDRFKEFWDTATGAGAAVLKAFEDTFGGIFNAFRAMVNAIATGFETFVNSFVNAINSVLLAVNGAPEFFGLPTIPTLPTVNIPTLAQGGIVVKPTLAMLGESGEEAVVPLDRAGAGEQHIHLHIDGREVAKVVADRFHTSQNVTLRGGR